MTKPEGMTKSEGRNTRPHNSEPLDIWASDFFGHWSLVIQIRFMVPMRAKKRVGAFHEPWLVWSPAFRRLERLGPPEGGTPYRWRAPARFMVPVRAKKREGAFHE